MTLATAYCLYKMLRPRWPTPVMHIAVLALLFVVAHAAPAQSSVQSDREQFAKFAQEKFNSARQRMKAEPTNAVVLVEFASAAFDLAEFAATDNVRESIGREGIEAAEKALAKNPNSAAAHYYLGMNLGQVARTKGMSALKLVRQMENEFGKARQLDATLSHAGPDRNLGLLYQQAPGWPLSIGNRRKARQHLEAAVQLAPDYPENRLNLLEAFLEWGERQNAERELQAVEKLWPDAKKKLTGETWASAWADWQERLKEARRQLARPNESATSPRNRNN